jgi:hypothetical protein
MRRKTFYSQSVILIFVAFAMLAGCDLTTMYEKGTINLRFISSSRNLTIVPDLDMDISTYTIIGAGPNEESFMVEDFYGDKFEKIGLASGMWEITVDGYNADGIRIATASVELTIKKNQTTSTTVTLRPLEGTGTFSGTVSWTDDQTILNNPKVWVTVRDEKGDDIEGISNPRQLSVSGMTATGSIELPAGWYEMTVGLYEEIPDGDTMEVWKGVFALRIVSSQTTYGNLEVQENQIRFGSGDTSLVIEEDMENPLSVSFTITPESTIDVGSTVTFTSTGGHSDTAEYRWYVDGNRQDGTSPIFTYSFPEAGGYSVSLLVLDRGAMGGYGVSMEVVTNDSVVQIASNAMWNDYAYVSWQNLQHVYEPDKTNASIDTWKVNSDGAPIDGENRILWNNQTDLVNGISLFYHYTDDSINSMNFSSVESGWTSELSQDELGNGIIQFTRDSLTATATITYTLYPDSSSIVGEINFTAKDYGRLMWGVNLINCVWVNQDPGEIALYDKAYLNEQEITASEIAINPARVEGIDYLRDYLVSTGIAGIVSTEKDWELSFELLETTKDINLESHVVMSTIYGGWGFDRLAGVNTYLEPGENINIKGRFNIN